jgi:Zn-dependent protease
VIFGRTDPAEIIGIIVALVVGITFHEFSHAFVADELGDHRPRALGRVSVNPLHHLDPLGTLFLLLVGFGWGRPVPVNAGALRPGRRGLAWVAAAGPIANFVVAVVVAVVLRVLDVVGGGPSLLIEVLDWVVLYNLILGFFNFLPVAPLDGWNFALGLLPLRTVFTLQRYQQYGLLVLFAFVLLSYNVPGGGPIGWIFQIANALTTVLTGSQQFFFAS